MAGGREVARGVVVADIGGTQARFARAEGTEGAVALRDRRTYATADFESAATLIERYLGETGLVPERLSIAVAGIVRDNRGRLTNGALEFDGAVLGRRFSPCRIVNDFVAAATGVPQVEAHELAVIGAASPRAGTKAVLGPGTGLGMGILLCQDDGGYRALPSEGGHGDLASTDPLEHEIYQALTREVSFVSWESVLSGPGLVNLYRAVCRVWETPPRWSSPPEITAHAVDASDPVCHQTVELFCNWLGSVAGGFAVTVCAEGGVYVCGGIVPHLLDTLRTSRFRRRFEARGPLSDYVRGIATTVVLSTELGLLGAAVLSGDRAGR
jgi:glucokinase